MQSPRAVADVGPDMVADGVVELIANLLALQLKTSMLVKGQYFCSQLLCRWI